MLHCENNRFKVVNSFLLKMRTFEARAPKLVRDKLCKFAKFLTGLIACDEAICCIDFTPGAHVTGLAEFIASVIKVIETTDEIGRFEAYLRVCHDIPGKDRIRRLKRLDTAFNKLAEAYDGESDYLHIINTCRANYIVGVLQKLTGQKQEFNWIGLTNLINLLRNFAQVANESEISQIETWILGLGA
jgi:hypothetical protein